MVSPSPSRSAARRARLWLVAAAVAAWLPALGMPLRGWLDFAAFYAAGHLAGATVAAGPAIYDLPTLVGYQAAHGMQPVPFVYPASVALLYAPLAALPFALAAALHLGLMVAALVAAAVLWGDLVGLPRRWAVLGALAWGPAAASAVSGQNATVVLLLVVLATRALAGGSRLDGPRAGLYAGLAAAKPQLGAPVALVAVLRGRWAALGALAALALAHYILGILATGGDPAWPAAWLRVVGDYTREDFLANGWQAAGPATLGVRAANILGTSWPTVAGYAVGLVVTAIALRRARAMSAPLAIAAFSAAGLLVSPHAWVYDATLLLPGLGLLAVEGTRRGWPRPWVTAFVAAFAIGSVWPLGGFVGFTLVPLVVLGVPLALARLGAVAESTAA